MTRLRSALALLFIGLLSIIITPYAAAAVPSVYRVSVDDWYGFYRVIEINYTQIKYENQTLNINVGDTVLWINDADNESITITSEEGLWSGAYLKYARRSFNYTFKQPGTYGVYMKEFPRRPHQTIVVASVETPTVAAPSPTATETAIATASVTQTPQTTSPGSNLWYILLAFVVVAGIVIYIYYFKK